MNHSPLPWRIVLRDTNLQVKSKNQTSSKTIFRIEYDNQKDRRNAEYIVRAVNSHEKLETIALSAMRCKDLSLARYTFEQFEENGLWPSEAHRQRAQIDIKQALAEAGEA